ncbi:MAG: response regulator, partial [Gemmatimonadetes bacterium]|nr:response regulator [Gemmatimonadota bacterium]NIQ56432.1 response regulator [Gemmatimonadota bacterium]NIX43611.1 response regulator [Gemmatimonadota bacterium]NIY10385.1 response regulator [Gemmatimonadota bacterium]
MGSQRRPAVVRMFAELKRRRVFGTVAAYVVLAALLIELSGAIFEALLLPDWSARLVTVLLILGFPIVVVLSWFFDISLGGIERTGEQHGQGRAGDRDLGAVFRRSRAAPVPDAPVRRRRTATPEEGPTVAPDPERVREAALGHMRHELRTPINGILGYAEMVLEDVGDDALAADLERIREAGRGLLERVDAVLLGEGVAGDRSADLESFADKVRLDLRTPISAVVGYAEMLIESCEEAGRDELLGDLERILHSARRLLEVSEDIVRMATVPGGGPDELVATAAVTEQLLSRIQPVSGGPEGEGRLLVVDDNETNRDLISRQLARFGYTVATASDGLEALDRLKREEFDLILLDVIMPGLDGVETLVRLRDDNRLVDTPVIMLSSLNELDSAVRCIAMGATDYIAKPVQPALLEARIAQALEVRDLRSREHAYRRRVEADAALIDRLLGGAFPDFVLDRVRDGTLE